MVGLTIFHQIFLFLPNKLTKVKNSKCTPSPPKNKTDQLSKCRAQAFPIHCSTGTQKFNIISNCQKLSILQCLSFHSTLIQDQTYYMLVQNKLHRFLKSIGCVFLNVSFWGIINGRKFLQLYFACGLPRGVWLTTVGNVSDGFDQFVFAELFLSRFKVWWKCKDRRCVSQDQHFKFLKKRMTMFFFCISFCHHQGYSCISWMAVLQQVYNQLNF